MTIRQVSLAPVRKGKEPGTVQRNILQTVRSICALHTCDRLSAAGRSCSCTCLPCRSAKARSHPFDCPSAPPTIHGHRRFGEVRLTRPQSGARDVVVRHVLSGPRDAERHTIAGNFRVSVAVGL